jgi:integrin beta 3
MGPAGEKGERGERGEKGMDGQSGLMGPMGPAGEKGADGLAGRDGRDGLPGPQGDKGLDGQHGKDGKDGQDGLGFDDLEETIDPDTRTIIRRHRSGDRVKEFRHKCHFWVIDRGVFAEGRTYEAGDAVTWGGNLYIAQETTSDKPSEMSGQTKSWRLAVRRGRDGKQGPQGPPGQDGKDGKDGQDKEWR